MVLREGAGERAQYHVIDGWQHLATFDGDDACDDPLDELAQRRAAPAPALRHRRVSHPHAHPARCARPAAAAASPRMTHGRLVDIDRATHRFVASSPRGFGDLLAARAARLRRRRRARARARRGVHRSAGGGVSRLPRIARRAAACSWWSRSSTRRPTRRSTTPCAPSTGARTSIRRARWPATSPANIPRSRTRASARCASRTAICDQLRDATGAPARHRDRAARRARACARQRPERHGVHRPVGRGPASARLSRAGRRGAAARESRRRHPAARRLAGEVEAAPRSFSTRCAARARWSSKRR